MQVQNNQLTGSMPVTIGNFNELMYLDLSNNQFSGTLPLSLCNNNYIHYILINNNNFTGQISDCICDLTYLAPYYGGPANTDFSYNNFCPPYPYECDNINSNYPNVEHNINPQNCP